MKAQQTTLDSMPFLDATASRGVHVDDDCDFHVQMQTKRKYNGRREQRESGMSGLEYLQIYHETAAVARSTIVIGANL